MSAEVVVVVLGTGLFLAFMVLVSGGRHSGGDRRLQRWAEESGYRILRRHFDWTKGPFVMVATGQQIVYRVQIRDVSGLERWCYVRFGGMIQGLASDSVEVRWDD